MFPITKEISSRGKKRQVSQSNLLVNMLLQLKIFVSRSVLIYGILVAKSSLEAMDLQGTTLRKMSCKPTANLNIKWGYFIT